MRIQYVMRLVSQLVAIFAFVMLVPFLYSCCAERPYWSFLVGALIGFFISFFLYVCGRETKAFSLRDGFLVVTLTWVITCLLGALPFYGSGIFDNVWDALFESVSGITATGASVIPDIDVIPNSFILWRAIMHWLGGMGIIVLVLAFLRNFGADSAHFFNAEASVPRPGAILPRIRNMAAKLWGVYVGFTVLCFLALFVWGGLDIFSALTITFSTISTGGFLPTAEGAYLFAGNHIVMGVLILFMVLGGGNFTLYYSLLENGWREITRDFEFKTYLTCLAIGALLIGGNLFFSRQEGVESFWNGSFMYVSMQTGSGFAIDNYDRWPEFSKMILLISTFIGGCSGSTTGAIKVFRLIVLAKSTAMYLRQSIHPHLVEVLRINGKVMQTVWIRRIWHFFFLYMVIFVISTILIATSGLSIMESLACVAATLGNVGLAFGTLGPSESFAVLNPFTKCVCIINMILGRLEIFTVLVVCRVDFWKGYFVPLKEKEVSYDYARH